MRTTVFKVMGGLVLLFAASPLVVMILALISRSSRLASAVSSPILLIRLIAVVVVLAAVGLGLLHLRKWAALVFSALTLCLAALAVWSALHPVAPRLGDANWLGFLYAALMTVPSILTVTLALTDRA